MKRVLCSVAILMGALYLGPPAFAQGQVEVPFADVPPTHWAADALIQFAALGVFTGYPDGTFRGDRVMSRYEVAVAIERLLEDFQRHDFVTYRYPPPPIPGPALTDVADDHWAADAVRDLRNRGIGTGLLVGYPDRTFAGNQPMTREEFAVFLRRLQQWYFRFSELNRKPREPASRPLPGPAPRLTLWHDMRPS